jgi:RNA polymerase sigma-70 factor (ECF subfamily)
VSIERALSRPSHREPEHPDVESAQRLTPLREQQLVSAAQEGDAEALAALLRAYQRRIYGVCARMVGRRDEAGDLTQEALIKVIEGLHSYDGRARFSTWLIRVTMNVCITHLRRERLRRHRSLGAVERVGPGAAGPEHWPAPGPAADPREPGGLSRVQQAETRARLLEALDSIDADMRSILVLRDLQQLEYQQIAEVFDIPIGTVKSRLFRAREALRDALESRGWEPQ